MAENDEGERVSELVAEGLRLGDLVDHHTEKANEYSALRHEVIQALADLDVPQIKISRLLNISRQRVGQVVKPPPPERGLLLTEAGEPLRVAVVHKRSPRDGQSLIAEHTRHAVNRLKAFANDVRIKNDDIAETPVDDSDGWIDLNEPNMVALVGVRISSLVRMAVTAAVGITWERDHKRQWFLRDAKGTGKAFHSDFDEGWSSTGETDVRRCYAHIGRIRRPNGKGTFLYLGGCHSPGTRGAVELLTRDASKIWEATKHAGGWSAIVETTLDADERIISTELVTDIHTQGKR